ncbi:hypothetical protein ACWEQN_46005 [Streptomyces sp. NPDC004129]
MLGTSILDRLVGGRPALTAAAVTALGEDPALGQLRDALSIPCTDPLIAREHDWRDRHEEDATCSSQWRVWSKKAAQIGDGVPEEAAALWAGRLADFARVYTDPLYHSVLGPLLTFADQFPMEISWYLK